MNQKTVINLILSTLILAPWSGLATADAPLFSDRNPEAPEGVDQYGQLAGTWKCTPASRQPDGSMLESDFRPTWIWTYVLNGAAIQDIWIPDPAAPAGGGGMGTNLRVYDAEQDAWEMVWTTESLGGFQKFSAKMTDGNMVMNGDLPAGAFPAHMARITFHNIQPDHFDWKYEASAPGDGQNWQLQSTLTCERKI
ncbi:MAG TPA: hypothetical protein VJ984_09145 [Xanthomonadales bacterium]|nr:hypothetical protein [Xanthomonadales bacterium]